MFGFSPGDFCAVLLSGPYLLSQALWNTFSWRPHNLNFCQSLEGFALRHACLISGMNKAQRQVIFLGSFPKLCWTTRIIVWSESCACRRAFSAGSSWIMVAVREREGCGLTLCGSWTNSDSCESPRGDFTYRQKSKPSKATDHDCICPHELPPCWWKLWLDFPSR